MDEVRTLVYDVVRNHFALGGDYRMNDDISFINDLEADSLDMTELILGFEDECDVQLDETNFSTVGDAIKAIVLVRGE